MVDVINGERINMYSLLGKFKQLEKSIVNFKCTFKYNLTLYKDKEGNVPVQTNTSEEITA